MPDKARIVAVLLADLTRERDQLARAAKDAAEQATHPEAKPENDKDTRGLELSYLAGAQAERVRELAEAISALQSMPIRPFGADEPAVAGALLTVECDGTRGVYLLAPQGGGAVVREGGVAVRVITPRAPLGAALLGHTVGEVVEVETQQGLREYELVAIE